LRCLEVPECDDCDSKVSNALHARSTSLGGNIVSKRLHLHADTLERCNSIHFVLMPADTHFVLMPADTLELAQS
jgi:hypothetical protein